MKIQITIVYETELFYDNYPSGTSPVEALKTEQRLAEETGYEILETSQIVSEKWEIIED